VRCFFLDRNEQLLNAVGSVRDLVPTEGWGDCSQDCVAIAISVYRKFHRVGCQRFRPKRTTRQAAVPWHYCLSPWVPSPL
jgi:hypothetical protein